MDFIVDLFYGILYIAIGYSMIKYRKVVKSWTGNFVWAEQYLGRGGTYFVLLIVGMLAIAYGAMYPFGGADIFLKK